MDKMDVSAAVYHAQPLFLLSPVLLCMQACIRLLQLRRQNATQALPFPYTTVPVAPISLNDFNDTGILGDSSGAALLSSSSLNSSNASAADAVESWDTSYTDDMLAELQDPVDTNATTNSSTRSVNKTSGGRRLQQQQGEVMECLPASSARRLQQAANSSSFCPIGYALGPRLGGECIQCGNGVIQVRNLSRAAVLSAVVCLLLGVHCSKGVNQQLCTLQLAGAGQCGELASPAFSYGRCQRWQPYTAACPLVLRAFA
jgi:hypothetical protein